MKTDYKFDHMFRHTCIGIDATTDEFPDQIIKIELNGDTSLTGMLHGFENYLRACGFIFDGSLEFVDEYEDEEDDEYDPHDDRDGISDGETYDVHGCLWGLLSLGGGLHRLSSTQPLMSLRHYLVADLQRIRFDTGAQCLIAQHGDRHHLRHPV